MISPIDAVLVLDLLCRNLGNISLQLLPNFFKNPSTAEVAQLVEQLIRNQ